MGVLEDIRRRLREGQYTNEEHVRFSLVGCVLQEYGWNIWDPRQVNTEFVPVPQEDRTKVDMALFGPGDIPLVFIEVKPVGGLRELGRTERQLRDYNRNMAARFCIITDGRTWHFYYTLTPGEFGDKRFKTVDLLHDELDDIMGAFSRFLGKDGVESDEARNQAERLLNLNRKERILADCLPEARRRVQRPPFPNLPDALRELAEGRGMVVSREEAAAFIGKADPPRHESAPRHLPFNTTPTSRRHAGALNTTRTSRPAYPSPELSPHPSEAKPQTIGTGWLTPAFDSLGKGDTQTLPTYAVGAAPIFGQERTTGRGSIPFRGPGYLLRASRRPMHGRPLCESPRNSAFRLACVSPGATSRRLRIRAGKGAWTGRRDFEACTSEGGHPRVRSMLCAKCWGRSGHYGAITCNRGKYVR